jgi:hypothetical protein
MRTIHKYEIQISDSQTVQMPKDAQFLTVAAQNGKLCLWVLVNTTSQVCDFSIHIRGTGQPANYSRDAYIGTVQMGPLVWHVFGWAKSE